MRYQFGDWILPYLREARVVRQFNQDMLVVNGKPYLVYNKDMGKFTVHRNAASIFVENSKFLVGIDDFKPTANVYAVGVRSATEDIRQEDEVVIHHEGEVRGGSGHSQDAVPGHGAAEEGGGSLSRCATDREEGAQ
ncbi:hypothetical protein [Thermogymnomonas acidicola]|uniref:hypothetical protein n=1 Tax=Thermogymnomonas acidicola TaxID=399579 RepID=UPI0009463C4C|nr:hypothetical protein [Thermogymnomonas acidicola]